ncbi:hypothetical protein DJ568_00995 [Mucilaginibacter hurinus]|uniref:Uncharacterized protein n=1 Tax=Mucilaginibacter hurinus TaxID=2201324 RepID=A0A367GUF6_9SPHI|nr:hypothetical protein DJ568_00995 [Mucilaginibacter hurinus]
MEKTRISSVLTHKNENKINLLILAILLGACAGKKSIIAADTVKAAALDYTVRDGSSYKKAIIITLTNSQEGVRTEI